MSINVIIADDHHLFIDGIRSILSNEIDIKITGEASNGLELIKILETGLKADIILTDIRMPVMDGISATREISKKFQGIPILALTMFDQSADVFEMLEAGARGFVTKEVKKEELIKAIHTLVAGKSYFSENLNIDMQQVHVATASDQNIELTRREIEILKLVVKGRTTFEIANQLKLSKFTVDTHRKNIHKKLNIKSNAGLVNYAIRNLEAL